MTMDAGQITEQLEDTVDVEVETLKAHSFCTAAMMSENAFRGGLCLIRG